MRFTIFISFLAAVTLLIVFVSCKEGAVKENSQSAVELVKYGNDLVTLDHQDGEAPKVMGPQGPGILESLRFSFYPPEGS